MLGQNILNATTTLYVRKYYQRKLTSNMFRVANSKQIFSPNLWEEQNLKVYWSDFKFEYLEYELVNCKIMKKKK
jgi:hypothetical protein